MRTLAHALAFVRDAFGRKAVHAMIGGFNQSTIS